MLPLTQTEIQAGFFGRLSAIAANCSQGCISSISSILANISLQLGRTLSWDAAQGQVIGDDEAKRLLRRPYRAPWVHPEPAQV